MHRDPGFAVRAVDPDRPLILAIGERADRARRLAHQGVAALRRQQAAHFAADLGEQRFAGGSRDHLTLGIDDEGDRARADAQFGQGLADALQFKVGADHAAESAGGIAHRFGARDHQEVARE